MIDRQTWGKAWELLDARERRNAWIVLAVVILGAFSSALMVGSVLPFLSVLSDPRRIDTVPALSWAYENFGFQSDYAFLVGLGLASLGIIMLTSSIQILKTWTIARFSTMRIHSISRKLIAGYLRQPYEFYLNRHSGEMSTRILAETQQVIAQFFRPAAELVASSLTTLAILGLLLFVEPLIAIVAFCLLGGIYGGIYALNRRVLKQLGRHRADANSERFRVANEALGGIKGIKILGRESAYVARYSAPSQRMARTLVRIQVISQVPQFVLQPLVFGGIILICLLMMDAEGLASGAVLANILPTLGLFAFAGQRLMPEFSKLYQSLASLQAGTRAVEIIHEDLFTRTVGDALPETIPEGLGLRDRLVLEDVAYHYPNSSHAGVRNISLEIRAGEKIGIVGGTGAGKTTLADLMLGLLSPTEGRLIVDGVPISKTNVRAWQQSVGYVPQDIFLTDASVSENIALGIHPRQISKERVQVAARIAQLDQFIRDELPDGYDTAIGERGVRLSGGQRQRIGIARALYHNADLIVFDEATSALDNLTEREAIAAIDALPEEKTVVMIAHRLSTVQRCDRIVVVEGGRVVGCDTWAALIESNSTFQRIAEA
ncbi:ABC transporter ATP-binding protein [uncultured Marivita sp.]|uniref:ABC transporter ATP-binding protein n=1 Tax=uncultured Marivita sp. TaxID=888080 RepID=UPI002639405F|nr:ABC transporter ATP-binding protein [uncultured Marivita sp.]